jgi:hypothetical protein
MPRLQAAGRHSSDNFGRRQVVSPGVLQGRPREEGVFRVHPRTITNQLTTDYMNHQQQMDGYMAQVDSLRLTDEQANKVKMLILTVAQEQLAFARKVLAE